MFEKLIELSKKSYSPYSNFRVASIFVLNDGKEIEGVNVESASFGATLCAERNAMTTAITQGIDLKDVKEVHLIGYSTLKSKNENNIFAMPCGICRQMMSEQINPDVKIFVYNFATKEKNEYKNKELLPYSFKGTEI